MGDYLSFFMCVPGTKFETDSGNSPLREREKLEIVTNTHQSSGQSTMEMIMTLSNNGWLDSTPTSSATHLTTDFLTFWGENNGLISLEKIKKISSPLTLCKQSSWFTKQVNCTFIILTVWRNESVRKKQGQSPMPCIQSALTRPHNNPADKKVGYTRINFKVLFSFVPSKTIKWNNETK